MMTPERWQRISEILEQALEVTPDKRLRFLDQTCSSDPLLRSEVQSFLSAHESSMPGFLDRPLMHSSLLSPALKPGDYRITSQLGDGEMSNLYRRAALMALRSRLRNK